LHFEYTIYVPTNTSKRVTVGWYLYDKSDVATRLIIAGAPNSDIRVFNNLISGTRQENDFRTDCLRAGVDMRLLGRN